jgi:hypothetical protein
MLTDSLNNNNNNNNHVYLLIFVFIFIPIIIKIEAYQTIFFIVPTFKFYVLGMNAQIMLTFAQYNWLHLIGIAFLKKSHLLN